MNLNAFLSPVDRHGRLTDDLAALCNLLGFNPDQPINELEKELMQRYVTERERWAERKVSLSLRCDKALFWQLIRRISFYNELAPNEAQFAHALVAGGTLKPQDRKNELLVRLWKQGIEFGSISHLGGDRVLDTQRDNPALYGQLLPGGLPIDPAWQGLDKTPHTEAEMMRQLWKRSLIPKEMRELPTQFITAEATTGFRANIGDALREWLNTSPSRGRVLLVSINPHAAFQYWEAVHALAGTGFTIHVAAPSAALGPQDVSYFTGALARWVRSYNRATSK